MTTPADSAPSTVTVDGYRSLISAFPTGVAVITAVGAFGRAHGLTCTSLTRVTLDPPTLLVCLNVRSGTFGAVQHRGYLAVNLLHTRGQHAAEVFATANQDRFSLVAWQCSPRTQQPWLHRDAFALAECAVADTSIVGDHAVVFGRVVHVEQPDHTAEVPLLHGLRRFTSWPVQAPRAVPA